MGCARGNLPRQGSLIKVLGGDPQDKRPLNDVRGLWIHNRLSVVWSVVLVVLAVSLSVELMLGACHVTCYLGGSTRRAHFRENTPRLRSRCTQSVECRDEKVSISTETQVILQDLAGCGGPLRQSLVRVRWLSPTRWCGCARACVCVCVCA